MSKGELIMPDKFDDLMNLEPEMDEENTVYDEDFGADTTDTDEVDELPPTKPVKSEPKASADSDELNFDFEELGDLEGVKVVNMGTKVSAYAVDRARFVKDARSRISILTTKAIAIKTHYIENKGNFLCTGGKCCEAIGRPALRYLFPIIKYDTDKKGKPVSNKVEYQVLSIGNDIYDDLMTIAELNEEVGLTNLDIIVSCKDEKYQKISFQAVPNALWKKSPTIKQECNEFWKKNLKHIADPIARKFTPEVLEEVTSVPVEVNAPSADDVDMDDVFGA